MNDLNDLKNDVGKVFREQILTGNSGIYKKSWLEITRDYSIAIAKLRIYTKDANLFAAQVLRRAMRYEIGEVVLFLSLKLSRYHTFEGRLKQVEKYQKISARYNAIVSAEVKSESYLIDIDKEIIKKVNSPKLLSKLNQYVIELEEYDIQSYSFLLFFFQLKLKKYQLEGNKEMIIQTCIEGMEAMNSKPFSVPQAVILFFTSPNIPIYLEQNNFTLARKYIAICYANARKKTNNWYVAHSYDILLNFYEGNFKDVEVLLSKVKEYPTKLVQERYELYKAYSALMGEKRFRVNKFINDIPEFSKDKNGYNVAVIIIQLLHLLKNKSYDSYIDRIEATNQYIKRAINQKRVLRSKYFLKILLLLPASNFHPVLFAAKSKGYLKKLENLPVEINSSVEIELIPYEMLYSRVFALLN